MINLYIEYFESKNNKRKQEILYSINTNIKFDFIDNHYIFGSTFAGIEPIDKKTHLIKTNRRCTFSFIFNFANRASAKNDINILINNDITLTKSFAKIDLDETTFYCITRFENAYDEHPVNLDGWSQDTWVWKGKNRIDKTNTNFYLGILGCDNRLAYEASQAYKNVKNFAYKYKTIHNHKSNIRTYSKLNKIKKPYKLVKPQALNE